MTEQAVGEMRNRATVLFSRLGKVGRAIRLGIASSDRLGRMSLQQYADWELYSSPAHNLSGLHAWEQQALARHFSKTGSLLLSSCGGGRELIALLKRGYRVEAFDPCGHLVDVARKLCTEQRLSQARILDSAPSDVPHEVSFGFDGAIVGWGGYMHIPSSSRRAAFLMKIRPRLKAGAPLLLSFFVRAPGARSFDLTFRIASAFRSLRRDSEKVELGDMIDGTFDHYFTEAELQRELSASGFKMLEFNALPYGHAVALAG